MKFELTVFQRTLFWSLLIFTMMVRLLSLGSYPLNDTTEARYGEIARLMAETGDWITPQIHYGVPFWAKPPLSTWFSALSATIFGVNEFAMRLPSLLIAFAVIAIVYSLAKKQRGRDFALVSMVVLATSALFFVSSGTVMTDPALLLGTTLSMVAFWRAMTEDIREGRIWGYLFFVGLAIGLLAKGPVALVLTGMPIGIWILLQRQWKNTWRRIPWLTGLMLCLVLSVPWYYLAERKTPGFLNYFLIGEHWKRFVVSGWGGDLYGNAHSRPLGTIWLYWLLTALPWSLVLLAALCRKKLRRRVGSTLNRNKTWLVYLALWAVAPMVFFSLAGNILWTYILPGLPAFALLMAELMLAAPVMEQPSSLSPTNGTKTISRFATGTSLLFALLLILMVGHMVPVNNSQKGLVMAYQKDQIGLKGQLIYFHHRPHSAEFYSHGSARLAEQAKDMEAYFQSSDRDYFAVKKGHMKHFPEPIASRLDNLGEFSGYYLLREKTPYDKITPG